MKRVFLALTTISLLQAQPSVKEFGAVGDGVTDDSAAFARAVRSLEGAGGALRVPKGIFNLGQTGIVIPKTFGGIRLVGDSATASKLLYRGNGPAVQMGAEDGFTYGHTISDIQIDLTHAGPDAVGIKLFAGLYFALVRVHITSGNTFPPAVNQQMGIVAIGGNSVNKMFGAYLRIDDPRINGRFRKGIYFTASEIGWGYNSCILQGGAIVYAGAPERGTIGLHIEQGNQNLITLVDVEQFEIGMKSEAYANLFMASRTEGNLLGLLLTGAADRVTGGAFNRVISGFHGDGMRNQSHGSQFVATNATMEASEAGLMGTARGN